MARAALNFDEGTTQQDDTEDKEETSKDNSDNSLIWTSPKIPLNWMEEIRETMEKLSKTFIVLHVAQEEL